MNATNLRWNRKHYIQYCFNFCDYAMDLNKEETNAGGENNEEDKPTAFGKAKGSGSDSKLADAAASSCDVSSARESHSEHTMSSSNSEKQDKDGSEKETLKQRDKEKDGGKRKRERGGEEGGTKDCLKNAVGDVRETVCRIDNVDSGSYMPEIMGSDTTKSTCRLEFQLADSSSDSHNVENHVDLLMTPISGNSHNLHDSTRESGSGTGSSKPSKRSGKRKGKRRKKRPESRNNYHEVTPQNQAPVEAETDITDAGDSNCIDSSLSSVSHSDLHICNETSAGMDGKTNTEHTDKPQDEPQNPLTNMTGPSTVEPSCNNTPECCLKPHFRDRDKAETESHKSIDSMRSINEIPKSNSEATTENGMESEVYVTALENISLSEVENASDKGAAAQLLNAYAEDNQESSIQGYPESNHVMEINGVAHAILEVVENDVHININEHPDNTEQLLHIEEQDLSGHDAIDDDLIDLVPIERERVILVGMEHLTPNSVNATDEGLKKDVGRNSGNMVDLEEIKEHGTSSHGVNQEYFKFQDASIVLTEQNDYILVDRIEVSCAKLFSEDANECAPDEHVLAEDNFTREIMVAPAMGVAIDLKNRDTSLETNVINFNDPVSDIQTDCVERVSDTSEMREHISQQFENTSHQHQLLVNNEHISTEHLKNTEIQKENDTFQNEIEKGVYEKSMDEPSIAKEKAGIGEVISEELIKVDAGEIECKEYSLENITYQLSEFLIQNSIQQNETTIVTEIDEEIQNDNLLKDEKLKDASFDEQKDVDHPAINDKVELCPYNFSENLLCDVSTDQDFTEVENAEKAMRDERNHLDDQTYLNKGNDDCTQECQCVFENNEVSVIKEGAISVDQEDFEEVNDVSNVLNVDANQIENLSQENEPRSEEIQSEYQIKPEKHKDGTEEDEETTVATEKTVRENKINENIAKEICHDKIHTEYGENTIDNEVLGLTDNGQIEAGLETEKHKDGMEEDKETTNEVIGENKINEEVAKEICHDESCTEYNENVIDYKALSLPNNEQYAIPLERDKIEANEYDIHEKVNKDEISSKEVLVSGLLASDLTRDISIEYQEECNAQVHFHQGLQSRDIEGNGFVSDNIKETESIQMKGSEEYEVQSEVRSIHENENHNDLLESMSKSEEKVMEEHNVQEKEKVLKEKESNHALKKEFAQQERETSPTIFFRNEVQREIYESDICLVSNQMDRRKDLVRCDSKDKESLLIEHDLEEIKEGENNLSDDPGFQMNGSFLTDEIVQRQKAMGLQLLPSENNEKEQHIYEPEDQIDDGRTIQKYVFECYQQQTQNTRNILQVEYNYIKEGNENKVNCVNEQDQQTIFKQQDKVDREHWCDNKLQDLIQDEVHDFCETNAENDGIEQCEEQDDNSDRKFNYDQQEGNAYPENHLENEYGAFAESGASIKDPKEVILIQEEGDVEEREKDKSPHIAIEDSGNKVLPDDKHIDKECVVDDAEMHDVDQAKSEKSAQHEEEVEQPQYHEKSPSFVTEKQSNNDENIFVERTDDDVEISEKEKNKLKEICNKQLDSPLIAAQEHVDKDLSYGQTILQDCTEDDIAVNKGEVDNLVENIQNEIFMEQLENSDKLHIAKEQQGDKVLSLGDNILEYQAAHDFKINEEGLEKLNYGEKNKYNEEQVKYADKLLVALDGYCEKRVSREDNILQECTDDDVEISKENVKQFEEPIENEEPIQQLEYEYKLLPVIVEENCDKELSFNEHIHYEYSNDNTEISEYGEDKFGDVMQNGEPVQQFECEDKPPHNEDEDEDIHKELSSDENIRHDYNKDCVEVSEDGEMDFGEIVQNEEPVHRLESEYKSPPNEEQKEDHDKELSLREHIPNEYANGIVKESKGNEVNLGEIIQNEDLTENHEYKDRSPSVGTEELFTKVLAHDEHFHSDYTFPDVDGNEKESNMAEAKREPLFAVTVDIEDCYNPSLCFSCKDRIGTIEEENETEHLCENEEKEAITENENQPLNAGDHSEDIEHEMSDLVEMSDKQMLIIKLETDICLQFTMKKHTDACISRQPCEQLHVNHHAETFENGDHAESCEGNQEIKFQQPRDAAERNALDENMLPQLDDTKDEDCSDEQLITATDGHCRSRRCSEDHEAEYEEQEFHEMENSKPVSEHDKENEILVGTLQMTHYIEEEILENDNVVNATEDVKHQKLLLTKQNTVLEMGICEGNTEPAYLDEQVVQNKVNKNESIETYVDVIRFDQSDTGNKEPQSDSCKKDEIGRDSESSVCKQPEKESYSIYNENDYFNKLSGYVGIHREDNEEDFRMDQFNRDEVENQCIDKTEHDESHKDLEIGPIANESDDSNKEMKEAKNHYVVDKEPISVEKYEQEVVEKQCLQALEDRVEGDFCSNIENEKSSSSFINYNPNEEKEIDCIDKEEPGCGEAYKMGKVEHKDMEKSAHGDYDEWNKEQKDFDVEKSQDQFGGWDGYVEAEWEETVDCSVGIHASNSVGEKQLRCDQENVKTILDAPAINEVTNDNNEEIAPQNCEENNVFEEKNRDGPDSKNGENPVITRADVIDTTDEDECMKEEYSFDHPVDSVNSVNNVTSTVTNENFLQFQELQKNIHSNTHEGNCEDIEKNVLNGDVCKVTDGNSEEHNKSITSGKEDQAESSRQRYCSEEFNSYRPKAFELDNLAHTISKETCDKVIEDDGNICMSEEINNCVSFSTQNSVGIHQCDLSPTKKDITDAEHEYIHGGEVIKGAVIEGSVNSNTDCEFYTKRNQILKNSCLRESTNEMLDKPSLEDEEDTEKEQEHTLLSSSGCGELNTTTDSTIINPHTEKSDFVQEARESIISPTKFTETFYEEEPYDQSNRQLQHNMHLVPNVIILNNQPIEDFDDAIDWMTEYPRAAKSEDDFKPRCMQDNFELEMKRERAMKNDICEAILDETGVLKTELESEIKQNNECNEDRGLPEESSSTISNLYETVLAKFNNEAENEQFQSNEKIDDILEQEMCFEENTIPTAHESPNVIFEVQKVLNSAIEAVLCNENVDICSGDQDYDREIASALSKLDQDLACVDGQLSIKVNEANEMLEEPVCRLSNLIPESQLPDISEEFKCPNDNEEERENSCSAGEEEEDSVCLQKPEVEEIQEKERVGESDELDCRISEELDIEAPDLRLNTEDYEKATDDHEEHHDEMAAEPQQADTERPGSPVTDRPDLSLERNERDEKTTFEKPRLLYELNDKELEKVVNSALENVQLPTSSCKNKPLWRKVVSGLRKPRRKVSKTNKKRPISDSAVKILGASDKKEEKPKEDQQFNGSGNETETNDDGWNTLERDTTSKSALKRVYDNKIHQRGQWRKFHRLRRLRNSAEMVPEKLPPMRRQIGARSMHRFYSGAHSSGTCTTENKDGQKKGKTRKRRSDLLLHGHIKEVDITGQSEAGGTQNVFEVFCDKDKKEVSDLAESMVNKETPTVRLLMKPLMSGMSAQAAQEAKPKSNECQLNPKECGQLIEESAQIKTRPSKRMSCSIM